MQRKLNLTYMLPIVALVLFLVGSFFFPLFPLGVEAFHCDGKAAGHPGGTEFPCPGGGFGSTHVTNPLTVGSFQELLLVVLTVVRTIAIPIVILFIVYAGFLYATARGNAEQTQKASRALLYAVIGGVIIIGAIAIGEIIKNFVNSF